MKISKLFHWLYAILMFLPFGLVVFNALASMWSGNTIFASDWYANFSELFLDISENGLVREIYLVYEYLITDIFNFVGLNLDIEYIILNCLTYWTCISIIWLVFDVFMYVPLLVHRWIDKAKIE